MDIDEFRPTDLDLLTFLVRFTAQQPLCDDGFITELDVYKQPPWITYSYGRHSRGGRPQHDMTTYRYFISPNHKKKGRRICRTVGEGIGRWKQREKYEEINNRGRKTSLVYESTSCARGDWNNGKWIMKEYLLSDTLLRKFNKSVYKDYAIFAIKKTSKNQRVVDTGCIHLMAEQIEEDACVLFGLTSSSAHQIEELFGLTSSSSHQIEECMMPDFEKLRLENNDPDQTMGETVLEKKQAQQEESKLVDDLVEAMVELEVDN